MAIEGFCNDQNRSRSRGLDLVVFAVFGEAARRAFEGALAAAESTGG